VEAGSSRFTATSIMMMIGGMIGASIMTIAMSLFLKKWMRSGRSGEVVPQVEMEEQANAPIEQVSAGLRELGFNGNADAVEHQGAREPRNQLTLVYSKNY
jgi:hypothetical protein